MSRLKIRYVPLEEARRWDRNAKKHDLGGIIASINRYGFRDAPIYDETLGACPAGNGRLEALALMEAEGYEKPVGIAINKAGRWLVPIQVGVDAKTPAEAEAFGIDHNNLTVAGGEAGIRDVLRMWEEDGLTEVLTSLGEAGALPETLDGDDLDALLAESPEPEPKKPVGKKSPMLACCPECSCEFEVVL